MSETTFDLPSLFEQAFGYKTRAFEPQFGATRARATRKEEGRAGAPYYAKDPAGTEYFMPVTISYPDPDATSAPPPGTTQDPRSFAAHKSWSLPYPVISIATKKTIVETPVTERRGTVKELVHTKDYEITIRGFMAGRNGEFPEDMVSGLRDVYEQQIPLSIQCPLTDVFLLRPGRSGSDQVIVTELKLPFEKRAKLVVPYELRLVSDEVFNLITIR